MQCAFAWNHFCDSEKQCNEIGGNREGREMGEIADILLSGMCTDIMTFPNSNPDCSIGASFQPADWYRLPSLPLCPPLCLLLSPSLLITPSSLGSCLHALAPSSTGQWECQDQSELYTPIGCKVPYIYTRKECDSMRAQGYSWHTAATTKDGKISSPSHFHSDSYF